MDIFKFIENFEFEKIKQFQKENVDEFLKQLVSKNEQSQNVLHVSCIAGIQETIKFFVDQLNSVQGQCSTQLNEQDKSSMTPLHYCIQSCDDGMPEIVELFTQNNIDVNIQTSTGESALHMASNIGQEDVAKLLLKDKNIQVNIKNQLGETPLIQSIQEGQFHIFNILIKRNDIDINVKDNYGYNCVHHTAITKGNSPAYLRVLSSINADLNSLDNMKNTPIVLAAQQDFKKYYRAIELLAQLGADLSITNNEGKGVRDYIIVDEQEKNTDYYNILYKNLKDRGYDIEDRSSVQQQQKKEETQQTNKNIDLNQNKSEETNQKTQKWVHKLGKVNDEKQKLQEKLNNIKAQKQKSKLDQQEIMILSVLIPLIIIALGLTYSKLF
ncbi:Ankyrin repeat-containing domain [Pseudocohnilembus persalinus]|uniref:Ankyrin repeat-containing domain n=1 Tax=Pseudocohnilembus persalinus TaxID=266149 RepID=A0A0V0R3H7_PSEPJ|nr:Ankyrin repeat-containing domain [Pseudocohnilembus persalinus]|eukprot:KRX08760.1 Ankyrin repeat-containing domain [Pseudocohnilembus persalinus]